MDLELLRKQIDQLDDSLVELFDKRMDLSKQVGLAKAQQDTNVNAPQREKAILTRLTQKVADEKKVFLKQLYNTIFHLSKAYQSRFVQNNSVFAETLRQMVDAQTEFPLSAAVACQGVFGSYSSIAAEKMFELPDVTFFKTFEGVFDAIESGLCRFGVLPIENSNTGSILPVYDLLKKHKCYIVKSARVQVMHSLVAKKGTDLSKIKKVISHEQGLMQCAEFLKNLGVETVAVANTAVAARTVAESDDETVAAICSPQSAAIYNLQELQSNVQDNASNYTRFICISKNMQVFKGARKISVIINAAHTPGSLNNVLSRFSALNLNVTKLESRPISNMEFQYLFYFDFEADIAEEKIINLLADLENTLPGFVFLGSYAEVL